MDIEAIGDTLNKLSINLTNARYYMESRNCDVKVAITKIKDTEKILDDLLAKMYPKQENEEE